MIVKLIPISDRDTAVRQLPEPNMIVDPRPIDIISGMENYKFEVAVNGMVMTVTRIDREKDERPGWPWSMFFRVYSRNDSIIHLNRRSIFTMVPGIGNERTPRDTTEIVVKDGVETIRVIAFQFCSSLSKITITDTVNKIENDKIRRRLYLIAMHSASTQPTIY